MTGATESSAKIAAVTIATAATLVATPTAMRARFSLEMGSAAFTFRAPSVKH